MTKGEQGVHIGIGIATGEVVAGYAGTDDRATYTCIGSPVNLAARLETHTKSVEHKMLFDLETHNRLENNTGILQLPDVRFKGFSEQTNVFAQVLKPHPC